MNRCLNSQTYLLHITLHQPNDASVSRSFNGSSVFKEANNLTTKNVHILRSYHESPVEKELLPVT